MENKKICTGLVGYGFGGKVFHAPFLHSSKYIDMKYVVERKSNLSQERF
jgi:scyllo-inositol 2-dehydrogenase (NADP+)